MKRGIFWLLLISGVAQAAQPQPTIHVFGDSHSTCCFGSGVTSEGTTTHHNIPFTDTLSAHLAVHHLGPRTMHRIGRDGFGILNFQKHNVQNGDTVVLTFGEIDVRCHIGKQRDERKRTLYEIIDTLVEKYVATINLNRSKYDQLHIVIVQVVPPSDKDFNASYPRHGTLEDRALVNKALNTRLFEACCENSFLFLPLYDLYATTAGTLQFDISDGGVHVNPKYNSPLRMRLIEPLLQPSRYSLTPLIYIFSLLLDARKTVTR